MEHQTLEKLSSTAPMLPSENGNERVLILTPTNGPVGKILIREDTILANLQGCTGCGRTQFTCGGKSPWPTFCPRKNSDRRYYCVTIFLSAIFVLSLLGTIIFSFTNTINDAVIDNMVLRNDSRAFHMWQKPTVHPWMKVYIFNYTNWDRVRDGYDEKLKVEEVGPFVYSQETEKVNIQFEGDYLSYQERNTFRYMPKESNGVPFEQVQVPNLPLLGVISMVSNVNFLTKMTLNSMLMGLSDHPNPFVKLPVHRFLWGYEDTIISTAKPILSFLGKLKFDKFGLLVTKNGTQEDYFTMNTGEHDKKMMNVIEKVNGVEELSFWGTSECNSVKASDGIAFPPSDLDGEKLLNVYFPNMCRRLPFQYEKNVVTHDGIELMRYRMPLNVFDDPINNPYNQCYCEIDSGTCPPKGVINVTECAWGVPILVSFPHFYLGDEKLREDVLGLNPDASLHDSYLDIHPTLGVTLNAKSSIQINMQVKKTDIFRVVDFLPDGLILPVAWFDVGVDELPPSIRSMIYHGTYSTAAAQLTLIVCCSLTLVVSGTSLFCMYVRRRPKPCITIRQVTIETDKGRT